MENNLLVLQQYTGGKSGAMANRKMHSREMAGGLFEVAKMRLLNVNCWFEYAGEKGPHFQLTDSRGKAIHNTIATEGCLIRIKVNAPGNKDGDGFDWVVIEEMLSAAEPEKDEETFGFRVRPVPNPNAEKINAAHFYTSEATSAFLIVRRGNLVSAFERGRNEVPNIHGSFLAAVRNFFVSIGGMLGLSVPAWKRWAESMLEPEREG